MVNLTRIYTRTGDQGTTSLGDMSRVAKTDLRIAAYADANEANAVIGTAIALGGLGEEIVTVLSRVQNDLFDVGADLSTPVVENPKYPPLRIEQSYIDRLEADCDRFNAELDKLRSFILPGGTPGAALLHQACTGTRDRNLKAAPSA
jgi:cob(I)alamin adenosyltransferase